MKKILKELKTMRMVTRNGYFLITFDPKSRQWDISMPQAKYRSHWRNSSLKKAIRECLKWVYENRLPITRQDYEL